MYHEKTPDEVMRVAGTLATVFAGRQQQAGIFEPTRRQDGDAGANGEVPSRQCPDR